MIDTPTPAEIMLQDKVRRIHISRGRSGDISFSWGAATKPGVWRIVHPSLETLHTRLRAQDPLVIKLHAVVTQARLLGIIVENWP